VIRTASRGSQGKCQRFDDRITGVQCDGVRHLLFPHSVWRLSHQRALDLITIVMPNPPAVGLMSGLTRQNRDWVGTKTDLGQVWT